MGRFRQKTIPGNIIHIGGDTVSPALCVTLFSSTVYKDLILLAIMPAEDVSDVHISPSSIQSMVYTSAVPIAKKRWPVVGQVECPSNLGAYSMRISAGNVWCGDEQLREANQRDRDILPVMDCAGMTLVEAYIAFLRSQRPEKKYFTRNRERFARFLARVAEFADVADLG
jgi:hypothetical protein